MKSFSVLLHALFAFVLVGLAGPLGAQPVYPNKPIRFIVPYAPGGATSLLSRLVGQKLTESWGQPVVVDNRPGGMTVVSTEALLRSRPDGYTILMVSSSHILSALLLPTAYDVQNLAPVATLGRNRFILVVHPSVPAGNLQEFIALAKSKPGQLNYATAGSGTVSHLAGETLNVMAGIKMQAIPYKGAGPALNDLLGGQVQLFITLPLNVLSHIGSGKLRPIAITGEARSTVLPQVPTFAEAGLPGYNMGLWYGISAPLGTPKEIISKLSGEIARILALPDIHEFLVKQGMEPFISTPEQLAALMKADAALYGKVVKAANLKSEQ